MRASNTVSYGMNIQRRDTSATSRLITWCCSAEVVNRSAHVERQSEQELGALIDGGRSKLLNNTTLDLRIYICGPLVYDLASCRGRRRGGRAPHIPKPPTMKPQVIAALADVLSGVTLPPAVTCVPPGQPYTELTQLFLHGRTTAGGKCAAENPAAADWTLLGRQVLSTHTHSLSHSSTHHNSTGPVVQRLTSSYTRHEGWCAKHPDTHTYPSPGRQPEQTVHTNRVIKTN